MEMRARLKKKMALPAIIAAVFALAFFAALAALTEIEPFYPEASGEKIFTSMSLTMDYSHIDMGYIMLKHEGSQREMRVLITKDKERPTQYFLIGDGEYHVYPIAHGSGRYRFDVYENMGKGFAQMMSEVIDIEIPNEFSPFVMPNLYTNYTPESQAVLKANELFEGLTEDRDKVKAAWDYVTTHIVYDFDKAAKGQELQPYFPDVDATLAEGKGVCFDYSALFGAMLRSHGIPTQMIHGYLRAGNNPYHAWSNVYYDGEWHLMDSTYAAQQYPDSVYVVDLVH